MGMLQHPLEGSLYQEVIWKVYKSILEGTQYLILVVTLLMLLIRLVLL